MTHQSALSSLAIAGTLGIMIAAAFISATADPEGGALLGQPRKAHGGRCTLLPSDLATKIATNDPPRIYRM
jgi:hypothetical protein